MDADQLSQTQIKDRNMRLNLVLLWIFALFNYTYADLGMLFTILTRPELLSQLQSGSVGSILLSPELFLGGAVLMEIGFAMLLASWMLPFRWARWANVAAGTLYTLVILGTLFGGGRMPQLNFSTFFQVIEIACTAAIVRMAWTWRLPSTTPQA